MNFSFQIKVKETLFNRKYFLYEGSKNNERYINLIFLKIKTP